MNPDPIVIAQLLKVNGLTPQSPQDQILDLLTKAGYKPEEIQSALANLSSASVTEAVPPIAQLATPQVSELPTQKKTMRFLALVSIIVVLVVIGGGGAYAYYTYIAPSPLTILKQVFDGASTITTVTFTATSTGSATINALTPIASLGQNSPISSSYMAVIQGSADVSSSTAPLFDVTTNSTMGLKIATSSGSATVGAHLIYLHKKIYIDLTNFNLMFTSSDKSLLGEQFLVGIVNSFVGRVENQWIAIDATSTPLINKADASPQLLSDYASLRAYMLGFSYITSVETVGTENVNGVETYHLKVHIQNRPQLAPIVQKIILDSQPPQSTGQNMAVLTQEISDINKSLMQPFSFDIWTGKSDHRLYKMVVAPFTIASSQTQATTTITDEEVSFGNYGQPVTIVAPPNAKPFEQFLKSL